MAIPHGTIMGGLSVVPDLAAALAEEGEGALRLGKCRSRASIRGGAWQKDIPVLTWVSKKRR